MAFMTDTVHGHGAARLNGAKGPEKIGAFPDMPHLPDLPDLLPANTTPESIVSQIEGILSTTRDRVHQIECCSRHGEQLGHIRLVVIDIRRITFVLQKLKPRVAGFDAWYAPIQTLLKADPLLKYFVDLRNEIEKEGLPGVMAEIYRTDTGEVIADVACWEDKHGLMTSGAVRPNVDLPTGEIEIPTAARNFRLPDPPTMHGGQELSDLRFATLARLALDFIEAHVVDPARVKFGEPI